MDHENMKLQNQETSSKSRSPSEHNRRSATTLSSCSPFRVVLGCTFALVAAIASKLVLDPIYIDQANRLRLLLNDALSPIRDERQGNSAPDAFFNGIPVILLRSEFYSSMHCLGDTFDPEDSWMFRSCHFSQACFDLKQQDWVVFPGPHEYAMLEALQGIPVHQQAWIAIQSMLLQRPAMALEPLHPYWHQSIEPQSLQWFPRIATTGPSVERGYYQLPDSFLILPLSFNSNVASWAVHRSESSRFFWEIIIPAYILLASFGGENHGIGLMDVIQESRQGMGCNIDAVSRAQCAELFEPFAPLFGRNSSHDRIPTNQDSLLELNGQPLGSSLVCTKHLLAGLGMMGDTGQSRTGTLSDFTHLAGRGAILHRFRSWSAQRIGVPASTYSSLPHSDQADPFVVTIAVDPTNKSNSFLTRAAVKSIHQMFHAKDVTVQGFVLEEMDLSSQLRLVAKSMVLIIQSDDPASHAAIFLPNRAKLIVYDQHVEQMNDNPLRSSTTMQYWLTNAGYFETEWWPTSTDFDQQKLFLFPLMQHLAERLRTFRLARNV